MQQLHSILQARANTDQGSPTKGQQGATADKFAVHLNQLTDQLDGQRNQAQATAVKANDTRAVSELARTMLTSADDDTLSADDAWLSMVEELNSMATGNVSLEELSSRHGIDVAQLEEQLSQALAEFGGDMKALIAQLQQVSGGKGLPPASAADMGPEIQISLHEALAESETDGNAESVEALLQRIDKLSPAQQSQFAESVSALMAQLQESEPGAEAKAAGEQINSGNHSAEDLAGLSAQLQSQINLLLESDVELSQQQREQLEQYAALVDNLSNLSLQTVFGEAKSAQQMAEHLTQQELAGELAELLAELKELSAGSEARFQTVDVKALETEISNLLDALGAQPNDASHGQLMALLHGQIEALEGVEERSRALSPDDQDKETLARVNQLLSELNQKLELVAADIRIIDTNRQADSGSGLPPVAQALAQASQQLRAQLQEALQVQQQQGDEPVEAGGDDLDSLRRLLSESSLSTTDTRQAVNTANQSGASLQNTQQGLTQAAVAQNGNAQRAAEQPVQSAFETARQAQQAIDILGTGASERLRDRVSVMFNARTQAAEMRLDPPDLGRLNIRLNMNQEQATVSFQVTTPQAREALEQSLPRLREMLAEQGIELADANVSEQQQHGSRDASSGQGEYAGGNSAGFDEADFVANGELEIESPLTPAADGRVDYFV